MVPRVEEGKVDMRSFLSPRIFVISSLRPTFCSRAKIFHLQYGVLRSVFESDGQIGAMLCGNCWLIEGMGKSLRMIQVLLDQFRDQSAPNTLYFTKGKQSKGIERRDLEDLSRSCGILQIYHCSNDALEFRRRAVPGQCPERFWSGDCPSKESS
jgi:hypothetical protein